MKFIISILFCTVFFFNIQAQKFQSSVFKSGVYYPGLILAVDPKTGILSGFFETYKNYNPVTGKPETFCRFFIKGEGGADDSMRVKLYYPEWGEDTVLGRFYIEGDTALNLKTQEEPPTWSSVEDENIVYKGMIFSFDHPTAWVEIGMIIRDHVKLFSDYNNKAAKEIAILKAKECARVLSRKRGWLKIEIVRDEETSFIGWIKEEDFY